MPEGPSIVILREAVEALHLEGKKILHTEGNSKIDQQLLQGQQVQSFRSWGKHFLVCFKEATLRIHLLLFGSYRINERKETPLRLSLQFTRDELNFYACSVKLFDKPAGEIYDWSADIMADEWKPVKALKKLKAMPAMLSCDALLDQDIFAGSGNIIKNEVLFRIKVHPLSPIGALPGPKLKELVREVRKYAFEFLQWKKEFTLKEHWLAHTKKTCPRCNIPFIKAYTGKTNRRSFFCDNCQVLYGTTH
jgi:endonuclease-8